MRVSFLDPVDHPFASDMAEQTDALEDHRVHKRPRAVSSGAEDAVHPGADSTVPTDGRDLHRVNANVSESPDGLSAVHPYLSGLITLPSDCQLQLGLEFHGEGSVAFGARSAELSALHPGFDLEAVVKISHDFFKARFDLKEGHVARQLGEGAAAPVIAYHASKGNIRTIIAEGLDPRLASQGLFGRGLYFTPDPIKANDYCSEKGDPGRLRSILRCRVILGKSKDYGVGKFDRTLIREPRGFNSVSGFIRRSSEYVVYSADQVLVEEIIFYRFRDTAFEMKPCLDLPSSMAGRVVFITAALSEFLSNLQNRARERGSEDAAKKAVSDLLREQKTPALFLQEMSAILGAAPPGDLEEKIAKELRISKARRGEASGQPPVDISPPQRSYSITGPESATRDSAIGSRDS